MNKPTFAERCLLAEQCLPDAPYRAMLRKLHSEMMEALAEQPAQQEECPHCLGSRRMVRDPDIGTDQECFVCDGTGYVEPEQPAQQEPVALKWQQAPVKTQWGDEMVVASVAIDKDHTVCLYCERDQAPKVEAMFAQRTWVYLTDEERNKLWREVVGWGDPSHDDEDLMKAIEDASRRKNT
jgi:hypothetical protein